MQSLAPASFIIGAIALEALLAATGAWILRRRGWTKARTIYLAALPIRKLIIVLCVFVFVSAATASKESCGVDACGMAMAAAMMLGLAAVVLYFIGVFIAWLTMRFTRQTQDSNVADIFE